MIEFGSLARRTWCQTDPNFRLQVWNSYLNYAMPHPNVPGMATPIYSGYIYSDGSLRAQSDEGIMLGHVTGAHMQGVINGMGCDYTFAADRR
ncbi:MAG: hypothetical protein JOY71_29125 [Acetobacteraceae bacterium]|nr:hypothetical protein [Acetobacteraceae bacterium]